MIPFAAILVALHGEGTQGVRLAATGALEQLDRPAGAPLWSDGQVELGWRSDAWNPDVRWRSVRRWDRSDAEIGLAVSRKWASRWRTEFAGSKGLDEVFLATWSLRAELEASIAGAWVVGGAYKASDFDGFVVQQPELRIERYMGAWRTGMAVSFPWTNGTLPRVGGRAGLGWDWSDAGGVGFDLASNQEMERQPTSVIDRNSLAASAALRQKLSQRVVARVAGTWTRLESIHQRMEVRVGIECVLGR
jgi:YaiO family outer membrane protein